MAARKHLTQLPRPREKTRASMLMNRLIDHALGKCEMTSSQVRTAQLVLRKTLPDLEAVKIKYDSVPSYVDAIREANSRSQMLDHNA